MRLRRCMLVLLTALLPVLTGCGAEQEKIEKPDENVKEEVTVSQDSPKTQEQPQDVPQEKLSKPTMEAEAIKVNFLQESKYGIDEYPKGAVEVEYAICRPDENAPVSVKDIFEAYNKWMQETSDAELKSGDERWIAYHKTNPDDTIYLDPKVGMHLMRCDSSIVSYAATRWCYNRDYEPDYKYYYGHTYDAQSGRELSLDDFVTDTGVLADMLCEEFVLQSSGADEEDRRAVYAIPEFQKEIRDSVLGGRDDGLFAWTVNPVGFVFVFSAPFYQEGYMLNPQDDVFIPFSRCSDILRQELGVSYDHLTYIPKPGVDEMLGVERPLEEDIYGNWHSEFLGHIGGKDYLYLSGDHETLSYEINGASARFLGKCAGAFDYPKMEFCEQVIDPQAIDMDHCFYVLYYQPELDSVAAIGEDGMPYLTEPYVSHYGSDPIITLEDFEVRAFPDKESTKSKTVMLEAGSVLVFVRTDGESYIDVFQPYSDDDRMVYRLEIGGDEEDGYTINGHPQEDVISTDWNWEG